MVAKRNSKAQDILQALALMLESSRGARIWWPKRGPTPAADISSRSAQRRAARAGECWQLVAARVRMPRPSLGS